MNTSEIKTYEQWRALSTQENYEYYKNEVVPKVRFVGNKMVNVEMWATSLNKWLSAEDMGSSDYYFYRIKPESKFIPYTRETFKPFANCWFRCKENDIDFKIEAIFITGVTTHYANHTWQELFELFLRIDLETGETFPAGVEVQP